MEKPANCKDRRGGTQRASCQRELTLLRRMDGKDNASLGGKRMEADVYRTGNRKKFKR